MSTSQPTPYGITAVAALVRVTSNDSRVRLLPIHTTPQVAHQVFRKFDTYRIPLHAALLMGPPIAIVAYSQQLPSFITEVQILLSCYAVYYLTLALSVVIYRLSPWHPLARYPGPFWYRASSFCHAFMSITGRRNTYFKHLHTLHGDVVRTGGCFVCSDVDPDIPIPGLT